MSKLLWSCLALVSAVATYLNTDALIPALRGFIQGLAMLTVIGVSVVANLKVWLTVTSAERSGATQKMNNVGWIQRIMNWVRQWIERSEVAAIAVFTILPIPGSRAICTTWCSITQSKRGLVALLVANPIHVWTYVLG